MNYVHKHLKAFEEYNTETHRKFAEKMKGKGIKWGSLGDESMELSKKHLSQFEGQEINIFEETIGKTNMIIGNVLYTLNEYGYYFRMTPKLMPDEIKRINKHKESDPYNEEAWEDEKNPEDNRIREIMFICPNNKILDQNIILYVALNIREVKFGEDRWKTVYGATDRRGINLIKKIIKLSLDKEISSYQINRYE